MSIKDFNEIIFSYHENGSKDNKSQVEKVLAKIFEKTFNTASSGLSGKQLQIKNSCLEYCFSCVPSFVEQYHDDSIAHIDGEKDYDDAYIYFCKVAESFRKKVKKTPKKKQDDVTESEAPKRQSPKEKPHYVNNRDFSNAVVEYCTTVKESKESSGTRPVVTNYIATCFLKIAEGLSHKGNFVRYTYREEMVMDAVENCLKAIENYDIEAATRSGKPNAFAYFTQISWYAFLRRIQKEKKQQDIKMKYIAEADISAFMDGDGEGFFQQSPFVDTLRQRIDVVKSADDEFKQYAKEEKKRKRRAVNVDSDLSGWIGE